MAGNIECQQIENGYRCFLTGELDLASEEAVAAELTRRLAENPALFVIDLSGLEFIDSTGLRVLMTAQKTASANGTKLLLAAIPEAVKRVFDIANVTEHFEYFDDVAERNGERKQP